MRAITKTITATASGFTDFISMLSGALATSLVTTSWQDRTIYACTGFSGSAGSSRVARLMADAMCSIRVVDPTTGSH